MDWLLLRDRNAQLPRKTEARKREVVTRTTPDPYRGVPLGVECAWPPRAEDGRTHKAD